MMGIKVSPQECCIMREKWAKGAGKCLCEQLAQEFLLLPVFLAWLMGLVFLKAIRCAVSVHVSGLIRRG